MNLNGENKKDIRLLNDAFTSFNEATERLQQYYGHLEERVKELNLELEKKNSELRVSLQEKEEVKDYLNNILESLSTGVIAFNPDGKITMFNKAARKITHLTSRDVAGKYFDNVFPSLLSEEIINSNLLKEPDEDFETETTVTTRDKNVLQVRLSSSPVKSVRGNVIGFVLLIQDISKIKKLEEQVQRTNRLAAMGEIAVSIAHEIRNPLGAIELFASLLKKDLKNHKDASRLIDHISSGVKSLDQIISNLLLFTRRQKLALQNMDMQKYLDDSLLFISHIMKQSNIKLVKKYCSSPPIIQGDVELLKQVFLNIVFNAVQSMRDGGTLTISTRTTNEGLRSGRSKSDICNLRIRPDNNRFAEISFADTGVGISEVDKEKIFNPFFTTKDRGTGLGLAIVHNILESHGGSIDVESKLKKGSIFTILLPLSEDYQTQELSRNFEIMAASMVIKFEPCKTCI